MQDIPEEFYIVSNDINPRSTYIHIRRMLLPFADLNHIKMILEQNNFRSFLHQSNTS